MGVVRTLPFILLLTVISCGGNKLVSVPDSGHYTATEDHDAGPIPPLADAGCLDDDIQNCYTGPAGTENFGHCHNGTAECNAGVWGPCLGESVPQLTDCTNPTVYCSACTSCPKAPCYDGPPGTVGVGTCEYGNFACLPDGGFYCSGEITPQGQNVCGGPDVECSGKPVVSTQLIDIAFYLDDTGGAVEDDMGAYYQYAVQAIEQFVAEYTTSNFHYAIILLPGPNGLQSPPNTISIEQFFGANDIDDGGTAAVTEQTMANLPPQVNVTTPEPFYNLDILYGSIHPQTNVDWEPGARRVVIMFEADESESDEYAPNTADSYITNPIVAQLYADAGVSLVLFTDETNYYTFGCGGPIPTDCITFGLNQGNVFTLASADTMVSDLNSTLSFPCVPDAGD